ncbi:MAG: biphenyl 2,3-dioxygenase [Alphaproteobacteria bacterium]|nr:MAG: biphenyl 2,3-dioxygenase [Alphaproteobacteria bacterium]
MHMAAIIPLFGLLLAAAPVRSADLSEQTPIVVDVDLGSKGGELVFRPNTLTFEAGKLYKLVLHNPSGSKHYFSALRFASSVWTRKVEAGEAEFKGVIREIEVKPGGEAEWFFVPVKAGTFELMCTVPGHAEAGMVGKIVIR